MDWLMLVLGLFGGLLLSHIWWWVMSHVLVPKLVFSDEIARAEADFRKSGVRHQVAIKNVGKRSAQNVRIKLRLRVRDVRRNGGRLWDSSYVRLRNDELFVLPPGGMVRLSPLPEETTDFDSLLFDVAIREKRRQGTLSLDDVFDAYSDVDLIVQVIATDAFSRCTRVLESKHYRRSDIRNGVFRKQHPVVVAAIMQESSGGYIA